MKKVMLIILSLIINIDIICAIEINSKSAIMYNMNDDEIIYKKEENLRLPVASLTKIVTAITVIDNVENLDKEVNITYDMLENLDGYAKVGLKVGDTLTVKELLYALMLPSAGDAAQALAISTSGSIKDFSILMNDEIKKIGVSNSKFDNPIGMDSENNYSTAYDMAIILKYSLKNNTFKKIFETNEYYIESINKEINKTISSISENYNIDFSMIHGAKTGFTYEAGLCLASTSSINGVDYLLVTLASDTNYPYHIQDAIGLYEYYSSNYSYKTILHNNQFIYEIPIKGSYDKVYKIYSKENKDIYIGNDVNLTKIIYEYKGIDKITKKIKQGDKIGIVNVIYNNDVLYTFDVYLDKKIKYYNYIIYVLIVLLVLTFCIIYKTRHKK